MKRKGGLIQEVVSYPNMRVAWLKAIRGKRFKTSTLNFLRELDANLDLIASSLDSGSYCWGNYTRFRIFDPKEREIAVPPLRDRVAQHALINVCEPVFDDYQINQSFACRKGKGQSGAVDLAARYSRGAQYYLKLDVRKYFASIDRKILISLLERRFKDDKILTAFSDVAWSYEPRQAVGLPIGSLTSQFFANHYLAPLDRFVKEELKIKRYLRYMDDFVLFSDDKNELQRAFVDVEQYAQDELKLKLKEPIFNRTSLGLTFLGMKIVEGRVRLANRSRVRFWRKYKEIIDEFVLGLAAEDKCAARLQGLFAFARRAESRAFRLRVMQTRRDVDEL